MYGKGGEQYWLSVTGLTLQKSPPCSAAKKRNNKKILCVQTAVTKIKSDARGIQALGIWYAAIGYDLRYLIIYTLHSISFKRIDEMQNLRRHTPWHF